MRCAASHEYLIKMRTEGGLNGIKIGPQLGKGSYGRVFKGDPWLTPQQLAHSTPLLVSSPDRTQRPMPLETGPCHPVLYL